MPTATAAPPRLPRRIALSTLALLAAGTAHAHVFCATSAAQLQQALTAASDGGPYNGEDNEVDLAPGTYTTGAATSNGAFHYRSTAVTGLISIHGGFDANCQNPRSNPARAKLDGNGQTPVLAIVNAHAPIEVLELTVQNGESIGNGAGLSLSGGAGIAVLFTVIKNNHTTGLGGGFSIHADGLATSDYVFLETNLVTGNSADQDFGAGSITTDAAVVAVTHDTVYGNTTLGMGDSTGTGGLFLSAESGYLSNNIFRANTLYGFYLDSVDIFVNANWNAYGSSGGRPPASATDNTNAPPNFVDPAGGDFHLSGTSPLLAYSRSIVGRYLDLEGHSLPSGGRRDIGVYADTVFADAFDDG
ncbi:hypothetical protein FHW12_000871 [Dokdonella fugitiva]|uniref:Parallel beta helix pectate lyase-like protein n=1 Tax=Dokdonella fugitiva TaxID=328517 RepID=A0A839F0M9_9GAMM|nr:hypothetical protein [Dokdonella fugitiva]MBA8886680.1 hypothetical protein [Dokdonella fugitiva]